MVNQSPPDAAEQIGRARPGPLAHRHPIQHDYSVEIPKRPKHPDVARSPKTLHEEMTTWSGKQECFTWSGKQEMTMGPWGGPIHLERSAGTLLDAPATDVH